MIESDGYGVAEPINAKVTINGIEITDVDSWNKVIDSIRELKEENQRLKEDIKIKDGIHETTFKNLMEERRENQRLNNVLNELEKWIIDEKCNNIAERIVTSNGVSIRTNKILNKLKELKESNNG